MSKVAGAEIVQDAVAFFQAFDGMEEGFRARAGAVRELLADPTTAYVLVTSARPDAIAEAKFFAEKLARARYLAGCARGQSNPSPLRRLLPELPGRGTPPVRTVWLRSTANLAALNDVARQEESAYAALAAEVAPAVLGRIPLFGQDVHDLGGLQRAADVLFG